MSGNPTEEEKAKARTELKNRTEGWHKAAEEVEKTMAAFEDAVDALDTLTDTMALIAKTAEVNPDEVRAPFELRGVERRLTRGRGGILRSEDERIKRVRQLLEDLEKNKLRGWRTLGITTIPS